MPLKGKEPFRRKTPKGIAHLDQELFYCKTTHEVFTSYEDLFDRAIQCSSLIWSCELSGRGGLTFQEALDSETKSRKILKAIPWQLKRLLLSQAQKFKCSRLQDLSEKVYGSIQNRYVVGETVEVLVSGLKKTCEITEVRVPGSTTKAKSPKKPSESPKKASPSKLRYEVSEKEEEITVLHVVSPDHLNRPKGSLSKDKTKLFLKQCVESEEGVLKVKASPAKKYKLNSASSDETPRKRIKLDKSPGKAAAAVKNGKLPKVSSTPSKVSPVKNALKNSQSPSKIKKTLKSIDADIRKMFPKNSSKLTTQTKENRPALLEDKSDKMKLLEEKRMAEKVKRMAETRMLNDYIGEWRKKRDDLECDDLKDLPSPKPINCGIPRDHFGEAMAILEFLHQFGSVLQVKNSFSSGVNLVLMERALTEKDIQGPFADLLQLLLLAVFKQQETEEEEPDKNGDKPSKDEEENDPSDTDATIKAANVAIRWSMQYHGCPIRRFPLDPFTLTELLRLHLLTSGAEITTLASDRGNFKNKEDPGLMFKMSNPALMNKLGTTSVFLLTAEERLKVLTLLMEQLLTYPTYRDFLEGHVKQLKKARYELQLVNSRRRRIISPKGDDKMAAAAEKKDETSEKILENGETGDNAGPLAPRVLTEVEKEEVAQLETKAKTWKASIAKILEVFRLEPLGTDRAHRLYWMFNSVGGLFVEDSSACMGQCLPKPTPTQLTINGAQDELPLSFMRKFMTMVNNSHDKENHFMKTNEMNHNNSNQKLPTSVNPLTPAKGTTQESDNKKQERAVFGMCTADPATCLVHGPNPNRLTWGFFHDERDIEALLSNLNSRGHREFALKKNLAHERERLRESVAKCPANKLNILDAPVEVEEVEQRKSARLHGDKTQFVGIHPEEALEKTLREALLDNEDKIWSGGLGNIKVKDRNAWRTAIEDFSYDPQCSDLPSWGPPPAHPPLATPSRGASTSRSPSPPVNRGLNIRQLAQAMVQVASAVQPKYLTGHLAANEEYKRQVEKAMAEIDRRKQRQEEVDEEVEWSKSWQSVKMPKSPLEKWIESLQNCTSLSQLFLHLITLENSITWHRSALKTSCKICRKRGDGENMLLCDKCDRGFHLYCLRPPLQEVPAEEWFCLACTPVEPPSPDKQKRKRMTLNSKEEDKSSDEGSEIEEDEEEDPEYGGPKKKKLNKEKCRSCRKPGKMIYCEECKGTYHLSCIQPNGRKLPADWLCSKCVRRGKSRRSTSTSQRAKSDQSINVIQCEEILAALRKHADVWPFSGRKKCLWSVELQKPRSRSVKRPIDLFAIKEKLNNLSYTSNKEFVADVYLMMQNCELIHSLDSEEHQASKRLALFFQSLVRKYKFDIKWAARTRFTDL